MQLLHFAYGWLSAGITLVFSKNKCTTNYFKNARDCCSDVKLFLGRIYYNYDLALRERGIIHEFVFYLSTNLLELLVCLAAEGFVICELFFFIHEFERIRRICTNYSCGFR
jgi:hypothetical protein